MSDLTGLTLDDTAARALASIFLERTADAIVDGGAKATDAIFNLHRDTGLVLDVCAAVLMTTSMLAGINDVSAEEVFAASLQLVPDEADMIDEADRVVPGALSIGAGDNGEEGGALADVTSPVSPVPSIVEPARPVPVMTALPERETPWVCHSCTCSAIAMVAALPVCMYHADHTGDDPDCPNCGAWTPPEAPPVQPKPKRKAKA